MTFSLLLFSIFVAQVASTTSVTQLSSRSLSNSPSLPFRCWQAAGENGGAVDSFSSCTCPDGSTYPTLKATGVASCGYTAPPTLVGVVTIGGVVVTPEASGFVVTPANSGVPVTVKPGAPPQTIGSDVVSLGVSSIVIDSRTLALSSISAKNRSASALIHTSISTTTSKISTTTSKISTTTSKTPSTTSETLSTTSKISTTTSKISTTTSKISTTTSKTRSTNSSKSTTTSARSSQTTSSQSSSSGAIIVVPTGDASKTTKPTPPEITSSLSSFSTRPSISASTISATVNSHTEIVGANGLPTPHPILGPGCLVCPPATSGKGWLLLDPIKPGKYPHGPPPGGDFNIPWPAFEIDPDGSIKFSTTADMKTSPTMSTATAKSSTTKSSTTKSSTTKSSTTKSSTTKSSTAKSSTTEHSTTLSNSACSQASGTVAHGLQGRSDECSTPDDYCPVFDLPSLLNIPDDDEGTDDGSLLPGLNDADNPGIAGQKRSLSLAGRINLGFIDEVDTHTSGSWHNPRRTANWTDLAVRQAGKTSPWPGPSQCKLGKSVYGPRYPKVMDLPKFAPHAKFWYGTSVVGNGCQAWTIVQSPGTGMNNNGPGVLDARSIQYQFDTGSERLPNRAFLNTDHVYELKILKEFFEDDMNKNFGTKVSTGQPGAPEIDYCDAFKLFWDHINTASGNSQDANGKTVKGDNMVNLGPLLNGSPVTRMETLFRVLAGGGLSRWADFIGLDADVNKRKGGLFQRSLNALITDPPGNTRPEWINRLNLLGVAMDVIQKPEVQDIFKSTNSRVYGAFQEADKLNCGGLPRWAPKYSAYMEDFLSTQGSKVQSHYSSITATNLLPPNEMVTITRRDDGSLVSMTTDKALFLAVNSAHPKSKFTFNVGAMLTWPAEPAKTASIAMLKRDAATAEDACVLATVASSTGSAAKPSTKASSTTKASSAARVSTTNNSTTKKSSKTAETPSSITKPPSSTTTNKPSTTSKKSSTSSSAKMCSGKWIISQGGFNNMACLCDNGNEGPGGIGGEVLGKPCTCYLSAEIDICHPS